VIHLKSSKLLAIVGVCLLLALAGCDGAKYPANAEVELEDVSDGGEQIQFVGEVRFEGGGHDVTLDDVRVVFVAANGSTIRTITVGEMTANKSRRVKEVGFNATVSPPPEQLRLRIGTVDNPEDAKFSVAGMRRNDENRYRRFIQDEY
jgi:hypothetical protein